MSLYERGETKDVCIAVPPVCHTKNNSYQIKYYSFVKQSVLNNTNLVLLTLGKSNITKYSILYSY
jgi:hypothetical protein